MTIINYIESVIKIIEFSCEKIAFNNYWKSHYPLWKNYPKKKYKAKIK